MQYWTQITTYLSPVLSSTLIAALVSSLVSVWIGGRNRKATSADVDRKIESERQITNVRLEHELNKTVTDRAWIDYGLRRDIYLDLAAQIICIFSAASAESAEEISKK